MGLFEDYTPRKHAGHRKTLPAGLIIRPAKAEDISSLAKLTFSREGGELARIKEKFENELTNLDATGAGLLLVAELNSKIVGFSRVKYFKPTSDSPANICPEGWYLTGVIVAAEYRRQGIAIALTRARLDWIAKRARQAYYFANAQNKVSIDLHKRFGFVELTRDFVYPEVEFTGGEGILFKADFP